MYLRMQDRLAKALLVAHARELDQHRQIDAGDHLDRAAIHARQREIGGGASKHIRQDDHAVPGIEAADGGHDVLSPRLHVVIRANCDGLELLLRSHHML